MGIKFRYIGHECEGGPEKAKILRDLIVRETLLSRVKGLRPVR